MSGILIPVAGVGAGDQFRSGTASVDNDAATIAPIGFDSHRSGYGLYVFKDGETGAGVRFDFNQPYTFKPSYLNVPFTFGGGGSPLTGASVGDATRYGRATIENSAGTIAPEGFDSSVVPKVRIYYAADGSGGAIDFHFEDTYSSPSWKNTPFYFGYGLLVSGVAIGNTSSYGVPRLKGVPALNPKGIPSQAIVGKPRVGDQPNVDFHFDHSYAAPSYANTPFYFGDGLVVSGASIGATDRHGAGSVENAAHTIAPVWGNPSLKFGRAAVYFDGQNGYGVDFSFAQSYNGVSPRNTPFYFAGRISVNPAPISPPAVPSPAIGNFTEYVKPFGWGASLIGHQHVKGVERHAIEPKSFIASAYGQPLAWNYRQYLAARGFLAQLFGTPLLSGGEKQVTPSGIAWSGAGRPTVVNTTATQSARPQGIPSIAVPLPSVSPRTVFPFGILGTGFGYAHVQFPPQPKGWLSSAFGYPVVDYKTKQVRPAGISADEAFGYPVVYDPTQHVIVSSVIQAGVFGDTAAKNTRFVLKAEGFDSLEFSVWAYVESNRRDVTFNGFVATEFGNNAIRNKTPSLSPEGFDSLRAPFGIGIGYAVRRVYASGTDFLVLGQPTLTQTPSIAPKGFTGAMGVPTAWPRVRTLEVSGHDSFKSGKLDVWFRYRHLKLEGYGVGDYSYGKPRLEHEHRELLVHGANNSSIGSVKIGQRNNFISPKGIWEDFATGHTVGGLRFIRPVGYEATRWLTRIIPEITVVYPLGFANSYGLPTIRNRTDLILPAGITTTPDPVDQWGTAKVWNSTQTVEMFYDVDSDLNPPKWSQWTLIENRDKVFRVTGTLMSSIGRAVIANKATALLPEPIEAPSMPVWYKAGMVAFRIRPLRLDGIEAPYMSSWVRVYNDAAVLAPMGFNAEEFGKPSLENTRRSFKIQGWEDSWFGYPMVAFRIRHIEFEGRYSIAPLPIRMPVAKLYTRYIEPAGYETYGSGAQSLSIHWTLITPRWTHRDLFGEPRVHNVTPEVRTRGRVSEEFGNQFVRLEWREVVTAETFTQIIPKPIIAYRDRAIRLDGIKSMVFSDKLVVTKTGAPPYSVQFVSLESTQDLNTGEWNDDGYGIWPYGDSAGEKGQVPKPIINQQVLYHISKDPMTIFGSARITANTIRVEPGFQELSVGDPMVSLKIRRIVVDKFPEKEVYEPSKARITPHTIWATVDTPKQARDNHPEGQIFHPLDIPPIGGRRNGVGSPMVTLRHRIVRQSAPQNGYGNDMARTGRHTLQNKRHYIVPVSFFTFRSGWHTVPGDQESEQMPTAVTLKFGTASVAFPPYVGPLTIYQRGFNSAAIGGGLIEFRDRPIYPKGYLAEQIGTRKPADNPYMWQGLRVGELMPTIPEGFSAELIGEPWISFRVREVNPDGYDAFICDYDLTAFSKRMKVFRKEVPSNVDHIKPEGFDAFASSASDVKPLAHFIRPDGNSDQYRKGAF